MKIGDGNVRTNGETAVIDGKAEARVPAVATTPVRLFGYSTTHEYEWMDARGSSPDIS